MGKYVMVFHSCNPEGNLASNVHGGLLGAHGLGFGGTSIPPDSLLLQSRQLSFSRDLEHWTPYAQTDGEEKYCVLVDEAEDEYVLIRCRANSIGIKRTTDPMNGYQCLYSLGQRQWPWAQGRIIAGHLLDLRRDLPSESIC